VLDFEIIIIVTQRPAHNAPLDQLVQMRSIWHSRMSASQNDAAINGKEGLKDRVNA
jgi:hypothetical protein